MTKPARSKPLILSWPLVATLGVGVLLAIYVALLFRTAWEQKTGGLGLRDMSPSSFPAHCAGAVDLHRGSGNAGTAAQLDLGPRTFVVDIEELRKTPGCLGHSIVAAAGRGAEADYRLVFVDRARSELIRVTVKYREP